MQKTGKIMVLYVVIYTLLDQRQEDKFDRSLTYIIINL